MVNLDDSALDDVAIAESAWMVSSIAASRFAGPNVVHCNLGWNRRLRVGAIAKLCSPKRTY